MADKDIRVTFGTGATFADALSSLAAAAIPAERREELASEEERRTTRWVATLADAAGLEDWDTFTPRQRRAAVTLIEGASADTLAAVAALLKALSDD